MIAVIIAGGSGTRLWPLSTPNYPKHLMQLNGDKKSLLQNTYDRADQLASTIYVVTDDSHANHVKEQLSDLPEDNLLIEPARRGTANAVAAAVAHLTDKHDHAEPIIFMHADHYIRDVQGFVHSFKIAGHISRNEKKLVLVGVEPDRPEIGFGYIKKDKIFNEELFVFTVDSFTEKPDFQTAKKYIKSGEYLWNCGYFVGSVNTFKDKMQKHSPEMLKAYAELLATKNPEEFKEAYLRQEDEAIDYALIEKVDDLLVLPASFDWMDVGSYVDLHKVVESSELGNHTHGDVEIDGVENSFIQNYEDKPVAVIGLDNVVVVNNKHGVLVSRKDLSKQIGTVSKKINRK